MFFSNDESKTDDYFKKKRREMVEFQLRSRDIDDVRVWNAMGEVPREAFVPKLVEQQAYGDGPLSIGCGQTISQPYVVAFMAQELKLNGEEKVLEVGAGSGYGAAVLSRLASEVHTVERLGELAEDARERLTRLGYRNVTVHHSDGSLGLEEFSPYDGIVVTAGARHLPQPYVHQLAEGGRIVIPNRVQHPQSADFPLHETRSRTLRRKSWQLRLCSIDRRRELGRVGKLMR